MKKKPVFAIVGLLILAMVLGACGTAAAQGEQTQPEPRTLNVNGKAEMTLTPDIAYINIGVHTENKDATEAVSSNNSQAQQIMDALKAAGVAEKDMSTINFSIYPSFQYNDDGTLKTTVYMVDNTVKVTVRNLQQIGSLLEDAVSAGANNIGGIQFDVADKSAAISEARAAAISNAQANALEIAQAAGVTLGDIQNISFYDNNQPSPIMYGKGLDTAAPSMAVPVTPGQMSISVEVNIIYQIH